MYRTIAALICILLLSGCRLPLDPEGTTDDVRGHILKVGAFSVPLDEADAQAVARIAARLDATAKTFEDDPHTLVTLLEKGELHVVAGRLPQDTPFAKRIALSDPFGRLQVDDQDHRRVLGLRKGENQFLIEVNQALKEADK